MSQETLEQQKQALKSVETLRKKGDHTGALNAIEAARKALPPHQVLVLKHSLCLKHMNRQDDALRIVDEALGKLPVAPLYREKALLLISTGRTSEARAALDAAPEALKNALAPAYDDVSRITAINAAEALRKNGDYPGALREIEAARNALAPHQALVLKHSQYLKHLNRQDDALRIVDEDLGKLPVAPLYREKALLLISTGQTSEAKAALDAAPDSLRNALAPAYDDVSRITAINAAEALRKKGDYHGALKEIEAARDALPPHQGLELKHSQCLKQLNRQNDAPAVASTHDGAVSTSTSRSDVEALRNKVEALESSLEGQSFVSLFVDKLRGKVAWNANQELASSRAQLSELERSITEKA